MRKQLLRVLLSVSVGVLLASVSADAQALKKMTVQVPFDFNVRDKHYPAGTYTVLHQGTFLYLRNYRGQVLNVLTANSLVTPMVPVGSKLVFFESHGVHLLTQIIWEGDSIGCEFVRSGREEEMVRQIAPANVTRAQAGGK